VWNAAIRVRALVDHVHSKRANPYRAGSAAERIGLCRDAMPPSLFAGNRWFTVDCT